MAQLIGAIKMTCAPLFVFAIFTLFCQVSTQHRSSIMFPNERTTLDDCHLRYFKMDPPSGSSPANGEPTRFREFAHMAALGWTEPDGSILWQCGGSLIWDNFVLTAAHCVLDTRNRAPDVVRLGDLDLYSAEDDRYAQQFGIAQIIRHPEHKFAASYHDVALLKLDGNVTLDQTVLPACLWRDPEVRFKRLIATGWGNTGFAKKQTPHMLKVELTPIQTAQCSEWYPPSRKLRQGLQDQHLCAVDDLMDTCEGDSGGPLQFKLMHNSRMTPFVIGVTSFGSVCGTSNPGVYTRVSSYHDWIVATMRNHGAVGLDENYNETFCALRFATYREFDKQVSLGSSENYTSIDSSRVRITLHSFPQQMIKIGWHSGDHNCHGVIIDEDTVLTIADCTDFDGKLPTHIVYFKKIMNISKIFVHPEYSKEFGYNNIAILKMNQLLDLPLKFQPSCIYHGTRTGGAVSAYGYGRYDINRFIGLWGKLFHDPKQLPHVIKSPVLSEDDCIISERYLPRFPHGLTREQVCVGNDVFLVPGACDLQIGGVLDISLYRGLSMYQTTVALSAVGRDCGFGEHIIATRLASHTEWMKSILLPKYRDTLSALRYNDSDLAEGDQCTCSDGRLGRCVALKDCSERWRDTLPERPVTFCSTSYVICCSLEKIISANGSLIHPDVEKCSDLAQNQTRANSDGSMVLIAWIPELRQNYACPGVLISESAVLTTASCLEGNEPYEIFPIRRNMQYKVKAVLKHGAYNHTDKTNDLAIVQLQNSVNWSAEVYPACLWADATHTPIVLDLIYPETFNKTNQIIAHPMYNSDCQRTHPYKLDDSQLCTRDPQKNYTCMSISDTLFWSDSKNVPFLVGIAANVSECKGWRYMVYTRISSYLEWISENAFS